jgi:hypothetical protein
MGEKPISPLRQRTIEDMMVRNFVAQLPAEANAHEQSKSAARPRRSNLQSGHDGRPS